MVKICRKRGWLSLSCYAWLRMATQHLARRSAASVRLTPRKAGREVWPSGTRWDDGGSGVKIFGDFDMTETCWDLKYSVNCSVINKSIIYFTWSDSNRFIHFIKWRGYIELGFRIAKQIACIIENAYIRIVLGPCTLPNWKWIHKFTLPCKFCPANR